MRRAVFLDRDGVISENRPDYVKRLEEFVLLPGVVDALRLLSGAGLLIVVVSNQSAINRGLVSWETVSAITSYLEDTVWSVGGRIDSVYLCPHRPDEGCDCRKPKPGLLRRASSDLDIDLRESYLVGDALSDVQAALAAGVQPLMVLTGRGREQVSSLGDSGLGLVPVFGDLLGAAQWIVARERMRQISLAAMVGREHR
jgi:D-glycero-D-manno-heptose 1,7-bisphosphate phosphatase